ncbi:ABC transporter substrate-binding protein [Streptomyces sp. NPDC049881]|uniref:ABC transporter substrate-binding protein n=1 Tax=Streptomyces sp. NPDC049881 TaxID=3155778 RepID=UPI003445DF38
MSHKRNAGVLLAAVCLLAAGCGGQGADSGENAAASAGPAAGYPVTIDNCGVEQTFERAPERVVVMNGASVAEVSSLVALGVGDRIVANQQTYGMSEVEGRAEEIAALPTGDVEPNEAYDVPREAMLGLRPDFVMSTTAYGFDPVNGFASRDDLAGIGARSYVSPEGCDQDQSRMTIDDSYTLLRELGAVFGVGDRAEELIAESEARVAEVAERVEGEETPRVMVVFSNMVMGANEFSSVAANGIWNDILAEAGGTNAFADVTDGAFADLSAETVAATPVDALVVISYNDPDAADYAESLLEEFPQWPAAQNDTYTILSDSIYLGPSNDLAVERIARMLHPDAF